MHTVAHIRSRFDIVLLSLMVLISPLSLVYFISAFFPFLDFNNITWLNITKHIGYRVIIVVLIFTTLLSYLHMREKTSFPRSKLEIPLILYLASILNSLVWSSFFLKVSWIEKTAALVTILLLLNYFYVALYWLNTRERVERATKLFLHTGFVLSCFAFVQRLIGINSLFRSDFRLAGIFWDPNIFARYEVILLSFVISILFVARPKGRSKLFYCLFAVVSILTLLFSFSRSGYVTFLFIVFIFLFISIPKKYIPINIILTGLLGLAGYYFISQFRVPEHGNLIFEASNINRIVLIAAGIGIIKEHWIAGVGFGNYSNALENIYAVSSVLFSEANRYAAGITTVIHNWVIEVWAEQGLIGLIAFVIIFVTALRNINRRRKICSDALTKAYLTGYYLTIIVFLFHGFFYHTFITQFFFWVLFSLAIAAEKVDRRVSVQML